MASQREARATPGRVNIQVIARLFEVTPGRIYQLVDEGIIPRVARGQYDLIASVQSYLRHLRKQLSDARVGLGDYGNERARLTRARADVAEMDRSVKTGELVPADQLEETWLTLAGNVRTRILAVPDKIAPRIVTVKNPVEAAKLIRHELNEALSEIATTKVPGAPPAPVGSHRASVAKVRPAASADGEPVGRSRARAVAGSVG
jgi:phage terminase Nu1 subunit (DNA packaging protein)